MSTATKGAMPLANTLLMPSVLCNLVTATPVTHGLHSKSFHLVLPGTKRGASHSYTMVMPRHRQSALVSSHFTKICMLLRLASSMRRSMWGHLQAFKIAWLRVTTLRHVLGSRSSRQLQRTQSAPRACSSRGIQGMGASFAPWCARRWTKLECLEASCAQVALNTLKVSASACPSQQCSKSHLLSLLPALVMPQLWRACVSL